MKIYFKSYVVNNQGKAATDLSKTGSADKLKLYNNRICWKIDNEIDNLTQSKLVWLAKILTPNLKAKRNNILPHFRSETATNNNYPSMNVNFHLSSSRERQSASQIIHV